MSEQYSCIKLDDSSDLSRSANFLLGTNKKIDSRELPKATLLANQFVEQNHNTFKLFDINAYVENNGYSVSVHFTTHDNIGACALKSPTSGQYDYGVIIEPRISWKSLGVMLDGMGWKVVPELQKMPMLPRSSRDIPVWGVCSIIILRIEDMLKSIVRKFEPTKEFLSSPRGHINWDEYVVKQIPNMKFLEIPCEFSTLNEHMELLGAIRYTLQKIVAELVNLKSSGTIVFQLIQRAQILLRQLSKYLPLKPTPRMLEKWLASLPMKNPALANGLEAIQWCVENRGLAGLSDFRGLPWKMSMSAFFEAWVETISRRLVTKIGGLISVGRLNETVVPINWDIASMGTQKSLRPDIVIKRDNSVIIIDAKFKKHWINLNDKSWMALDSDIQEEHRHDLLQVLAYSTCFADKDLKVCLVYPCESDMWNHLVKRGRSFRKANIYSGKRTVEVFLTAVPMSGNLDEIATEQSRWIA